MSVRVRKLARELDRSPEDVLWLLSEHLSVTRYGSPEDMLPDDVAAQVRRAARSVAPRAFPLPERPPARPPAPSAGGDWMAELVPGVVPTGAKAAPRAAPRSKAPPARSAAPPSTPTLADERRDDVRTALADERQRLEAARAELEVARGALVAERQAWEGARAALADERAALEAEATAAAGRQFARSLAGFLEERGLRGVDEHGRALSALAAAGHLAKLAAHLTPSQPEEVRRILRERLTLGSGPVPESVGAVVQVSADRADLRAGAELDRVLGRLSERWLLEGRRRVTWLGVPTRFHALLRERIDPRVELTFRPGGPRTGPQAREEVGGADLVLAWNTEPDAAARAVWDAARGRVLVLSGRTLAEVLDGLVSGRPVA